jgi:glycosyltransferase involved in cell wall biosynthesis
MRVLMIAQSNFDYDARIIRLSSVLIENHIDVDLICLRNKDQLKYEFKHGVNVYRIMKTFHQDSIVSYIFFSLLFTFKALLTSIFIARKNRCEIVHVHNMPDYLVFSAAYHKLRGIPVILDIHDLTVELFKEKWSSKRFKRFLPILKFVEKISCNFADQVITVTRECVEILINRGIKEEKISLIMNTPDERVFTYDTTRFKNSNSKKFKFLYHGTIASRFGLHYFIKALPEILKVIPNAEFHIYGRFNNEYSDTLRGMIKEFGLSNNIFFIDHIPYSQLNNMIKDFDMGVVTYEQTEYMNLAMPTKAGEYAFTGLPFIISDLISVRTVFRSESVCYVNPNDTNMIAEKIIKLYKDINLRSVMSSMAYEDMLKISWNVMRREYLSIVNKLVMKNK